MPLLKSEPAGTVSSLDELFALAHAMETEAAARYSAFAAAMRDQGHEQLAVVFEHIAAEERGHAGAVDDWSLQSRGRSPDPTALRWPTPPTFEEDDAAEMAGSSLLTPYRVLTVATRNGERAFAFWSYIAAHATRPDVRRAAEAMAKEELGHVASFRRERRRAFHEGRQANPAAGDAVPAWRIEAQLAGLMGSADASSSAGMADRARELGLQARTPLEQNAGALAEALVDAYVEALDTAEGERLDAIQDLAERSVRRLTTLRTSVARP